MLLGAESSQVSEALCLQIFWIWVRCAAALATSGHLTAVTDPDMSKILSPTFISFENLHIWLFAGRDQAAEADLLLGGGY